MSKDLLNHNPEDGCGSADKVFCVEPEDEKPKDNFRIREALVRLIRNDLLGKYSIWG